MKVQFSPGRNRGGNRSGRYGRQAHSRYGRPSGSDQDC